MRTYNKQLNPAPVALNVSSNSVPAALKNIFMYTMAANITGTPTGTIKLQASNDPETNDTMPLGTPRPEPTNWADITGSTFVVTTASTIMWNVRYIGYNYVRVVYTDTSGGTSTATMQIIINAKGS